MFEKVIIGNATLYRGDCMDVLPLLDKVDAVIADPPYGIGMADWDFETPADALFDLIFEKSKHQIIFGGNYFRLPITQGWLCWHKTHNYGNGGFSGISDFELAWTSFLKKAKYLPYQYVGNCELGKPSYSAKREHPTQKPVGLMLWCIQQAGNPQSILDPFMGSGTTGVAAMQMGRSFIAEKLEEPQFVGLNNMLDSKTRSALRAEKEARKAKK
jgi:site-specific DNA-methyltransferase (adenine-specific)